MVHEGERITAVRDLTEDEASILGYFPNGVDRLPGLELESGAVIFPGGDEEGNHAGYWPMSRDEMEELVGKYIAAFSSPPGRDSGPHGSRPPLRLVVSEEEPDINDDGRISISGETTEIEPRGNGAGPAAWFVREEVDDDDRPDPEETPTPEEVMEMRVGGDLGQDEYADLIGRAERAHSDAVFHTIC